MLGVANPDAWRRTASDGTASGGPDAAPPPAPNHSPHFAPHIGSALRPVTAALTVAALDRFAAG